MLTAFGRSVVNNTLHLGQTFESWVELQKVITDIGTQQERVIVTIYKDPARYCGKCRMHGTNPNSCKWFVRARNSLKTELITITGLHTTHSCQQSDHYFRRMHTKSNRLADHVMDILVENKTTRACSLRDTLRAQVHPDVAYHSARAAKKKCLKDLYGDEKESFYLIPNHLQRILDRDPTAVARWKAPNGNFSNLFVCPSAAREAYAHVRPLMAFDGTHTRGSYPQMMLLATALDANNTVMILAYGFAPNENGDEWDWFLTLLREAIPKLCEFGTMFLSDREKGLLTTVDDIFRAGHHVFCMWHIKLNMRTLGFSKEICKMFDGLVWAVTPEQFKARLERIEAKDPEAADYIKKTADPIHYSRAFIPFRRWGKESSQQAEVQNKVLKPERSVPALQSSCMLWDYMMRTYFEKKNLAENCDTPFAPNIMLELHDIELRAYRFMAQGGANGEVKITDDSGRHFRVELVPEWRCTCGDFQDKLLPCTHAWRALTALKKVHFDNMDGSYSTTAFRNTYSKGLPVLLSDDLVRNPHCGPPLKVRKRGRPSEKSRLRFEPDRTEHAIRRCRVFAQPGHEKRNCPQWKGRRQGVAEAHANDQTVQSSDGNSDAEGSYSAENNAFQENEDPNLAGNSQVELSFLSQMSMPETSSQFSAGENFSYLALLASFSSPARK